jgi:hypothetical protein
MITLVDPLPVGHSKNFSMPMNNISSDNPMTTSGITSGAVIAPTNAVFPRKRRNLVITIAAIVPSTMEIVAVMLATFKLVNVARNIIGFDTRALYHFKEKPDHMLMKRDSLNEYITTRNSGK